MENRALAGSHSSSAFLPSFLSVSCFPLAHQIQILWKLRESRGPCHPLIARPALYSPLTEFSHLMLPEYPSPDSRPYGAQRTATNDPLTKWSNRQLVWATLNLRQVHELGVVLHLWCNFTMVGHFGQIAPKLHHD